MADSGKDARAPVGSTRSHACCFATELLVRCAMSFHAGVVEMVVRPVVVYTGRVQGAAEAAFTRVAEFGVFFPGPVAHVLLFRRNSHRNVDAGAG